MNDIETNEATQALTESLLKSIVRANATGLVLDALIATIFKALPPLADNFLEHIELEKRFSPISKLRSDGDDAVAEIYESTFSRYVNHVEAIKNG